MHGPSAPAQPPDDARAPGGPTGPGGSGVPDGAALPGGTASVGGAAPVGAAPVAPVSVSPRTRTLSYAALVTAVLLAVLVFLPAPFVSESPGPTFDTLGTVGTGTAAKPVIEISGAPTYPTTAELRLTTVLQAGGPGQATSVGNVLEGWWRSDTAVQPRDVLFPPGATQEQQQQQASQDMLTSQEAATVAALAEVGHPVPATLKAAGTVKGSGSQGVVEDGDVLRSIDGRTFTTYTAFLDVLGDVKAGSTVTLGVTRDGKDVDLSIPTGTGAQGQATLGVFVDPTFDFPVKISFNLAGVGGPSAGMMFALGIIDKLTPGDEAAGKVVAGTGTMDIDGTVGAIGGIRQKLAGARRDGATWFLAPRSNCDEVVGHVPSGLHVLAVTTLHEAREDVLSIGRGTTAGLPTCQAP